MNQAVSAQTQGTIAKAENFKSGGVRAGKKLETNQSDPFLAIIENMLGSVTTQEQMVSLEGEKTQENESSDETIQAFAAMFAASSEVLPFVQMTTDDESSGLELGQKTDQEVLQEIVSNTQVVNLSDLWQNQTLQNQTLPLVAVNVSEEQITPQIKSPKSDFLSNLQENLNTESVASFADITSVTWENQSTPTNDEETSGDLLSSQRQFFNAVNQAKSKIANDGQDNDLDKTEDGQVEIPFIPKEIKASPTNTTSSLKETSAIETPLLEQLTTGITEHITESKNEFTMTLKPEALGEITVKLLETEGGKKTLHIVAANAQTAQLLNQELEALKEAVRPMQVEVHEVVQKTPESSQSFLQQFDMSGQQFGQQQSSPQHSSQTQHYRGAQSSFEDEMNEEAEQLLAASGMNIYV
ncbi:flagellar hook-length control protein FliK [Scatolibacter rhodanostii]|uniref:flagellar hook-length control protein FliK n=1 Tax=Scatolibacter rhodanostii TaxID=2014781 RepID=UPI000C06914F|nr:flagellar hook-length control protein FliK [Scatolibacter rhodanostii]